MIAEPGTVVLFQFSNHIVASAVLVWVERFPQPQEPYNGILWFDPASIRVFEPVALEVIQRVWPDEIDRFRNTRPELEPAANYLGFLRLLRCVAGPITPAPAG